MCGVSCRSVSKSTTQNSNIKKKPRVTAKGLKKSLELIKHCTALQPEHVVPVVWHRGRSIMIQKDDDPKYNV